MAERLPDIPCPANMDGCKYGPECPVYSAHHLNPIRLLKIAKEIQMEQSYQERLRTLVRHPRNKIIVGRCVHDYLDTLTSDELPSEDYIDRKLQAWGTK